MRALLRTTSSRTVTVPVTLPARRALCASIPPSMRPDSPCTSVAQATSPSTVPSRCRSAEASTLPRMTTSAPRTEKVEAVAARRGMALGNFGSGFFENMGRGLQEGARVDRAVVDTHLEMQVRPGGATRAADQSDDVAGPHLLPDVGLLRRHVGVTRQQAVTVADLDDVT